MSEPTASDVHVESVEWKRKRRKKRKEAMSDTALIEKAKLTRRQIAAIKAKQAAGGGGGGGKRKLTADQKERINRLSQRRKDKAALADEFPGLRDSKMLRGSRDKARSTFKNPEARAKARETYKKYKAKYKKQGYKPDISSQQRAGVRAFRTAMGHYGR